MTPSRGLRRFVAGVFCVWAIGAFASEGLQQAAAWAAIAVFAYVAIRRREWLSPELRPLIGVGVLLGAWNLISPVIAHLDGAAKGWPHSGRYTEALDGLAPLTTATLGGIALPWTAVLALLAFGWIASTALGWYQHTASWDLPLPKFLHLQWWRMREDFGVNGAHRYPAGGFFFHRLRFGHGAVATLGPALALALALARARTHARVIAAVLIPTLLLGIYMTYARAALGAALGMVVLSSFLFAGKKLRLAGGIGALVLIVAIASSATWRLRYEKAKANLFDGERALAMSVGWRLVKSHPALGVGFGNHRAAALETRPETGINDFLANDSHNLWLTTWAETGMVGLALLIAYQLLLLRALWRRAKTGSWLAQGALLSFAGFHLLSVVHYLPYHSGVFLTFGLVWGLALAPGVPFAVEQGGARPEDRSEVDSELAESGRRSVS